MIYNQGWHIEKATLYIETFEDETAKKRAWKTREMHSIAHKRAKSFSNFCTLTPKNILSEKSGALVLWVDEAKNELYANDFYQNR